MLKYSINTNLVRSTEHIYDNAISAVMMHGSTEVLFRTRNGARQGYLLSPTLFNIFLESILTDVPEERDGMVSISREQLRVCGLQKPSMLLLKKSRN